VSPVRPALLDCLSFFFETRVITRARGQRGAERCCYACCILLHAPLSPWPSLAILPGVPTLPAGRRVVLQGATAASRGALLPLALGEAGLERRTGKGPDSWGREEQADGGRQAAGRLGFAACADDAAEAGTFEWRRGLGAWWRFCAVQRSPVRVNSAEPLGQGVAAFVGSGWWVVPLRLRLY